MSILIHTALDTFLAEKYDVATDPDNYHLTARMIGIVKRLVPPTLAMDGLTDLGLNTLIQKRKAHLNHQGKPVAAATINRSLIDILSRTYTHYEKTRRYRCPNKPDFGAHRLREPRERVRMLTPEEYEALQEGASAYDRDYLAVIDFALLTGLRRANLLPRWDQVKLSPDRQSGTLTIKVKTEGAQKDTLEINLPTKAARLIALQRGRDDTYVFTYSAARSRGGRIRGLRLPITVAGLRSWWKRRKDKAGLTNFRLHDTRHTAASALLEATGDLTLVKEQLGHRDIRSTMRYAHVQRRKLVSGLNAAASQNPWGK